MEVGEPARDLVLLEGSRLIVAVSVMGTALRFPAAGLRHVLRPVLILLVVVMPLAAVISGAAALTLGLPLAVAALVGATLSPTDPVLAGSIVSGKPAERDLPERLRHTLSVESGINDGLALPLVGVALAVVLPATSPGPEAGRLAREVFAGIAIGAVGGALAALGVQVATKDDDLEPGPNLVLTVLLAVAVLGLGRAAATDGILGVFVAGTVYNAMVTGDEREPQQHIDEAVNRYLSLPLFFFLGVVLPWREWAAFGAPALVFVALVLVLRRLPVVLALARPAGPARLRGGVPRLVRADGRQLDLLHRAQRRQGRHRSGVLRGGDPCRRSERAGLRADLVAGTAALPAVGRRQRTRPPVPSPPVAGRTSLRRRGASSPGAGAAGKPPPRGRWHSLARSQSHPAVGAHPRGRRHAGHLDILRDCLT